MTEIKRALYKQIHDWPTPDYQIIEGIAIPEIVNFASTVFRWKPLPNQRLCFLMRSQNDVPVGHQFDVLFPLPLDSTSQAVHTPCILELVTQQYFVPTSTIDHGWKTICILTFPEGVPSLIDSLSLVEEWYLTDNCVGLANTREWERIRDFMDK